MKQITKCLSCDKAVSIGLCYEAQTIAYVTNSIAGTMNEQKIKGHICPKCNKRMGFKTNSKKLDKQLKAENNNE